MSLSLEAEVLEYFMDKIFVTSSSMPSMEEYINEISDIWQSHWMTNMGAKHQSLMQALKEYLNVNNIELLANGHLALELSLQALNLQGEVITTPFTFASTTHAIVRNNLTPVFCDIRSDDFTIDVSKLESLITDRTCAIMPVHVYGNVCGVEAIDKIAKKYGLKVIYDAAHSFGVKYKGESMANFGDVSCYSFHATKVFNTIEGGAACFRDAEFGQKLFDLKNFGIHGPESVMAVGANAKMNEFSAAMGICNLRHINGEIKKRRVLVERYRHKLSDIDGVQLNAIQQDVESNYAYFPIIIEPQIFGASRNEVMEKLASYGFMARKYFFPLTNAFECFHGQYDTRKTPVALHISNNVLTLPLYASLDVEIVDRICDVILSCSYSR